MAGAERSPGADLAQDELPLAAQDELPLAAQGELPLAARGELLLAARGELLLSGAIERLCRRPRAFGFLAAAGVLGRAGATIRYRHDHRLDFAPGELRDVRRRESVGRDGTPRVVFEVTATFLGATGASGPAPLYLVALAADESDAGELRREFLDVFHHRIYELFAGWMLRRAHPWGVRAGDRRGDGAAGELGGLGLLLGIDTLPLKTLTPASLVSIAPLLLARGRPAPLCERALRRLLAADLGDARLDLEEFAGEWARLGEGGQMRLGDRRSTSLGKSTVVGAFCRDRQSRVRLRLGPIDAARLPHFSPGGFGYARIREALAILLGDLLEVELELTIAGAPSPPLGSMRLGVDYRPTAPTAEARRLRFPIAPWRANP